MPDPNNTLIFDTPGTVSANIPEEMVAPAETTVEVTPALETPPATTETLVVTEPVVAKDVIVETPATPDTDAVTVVMVGDGEPDIKSVFTPEQKQAHYKDLSTALGQEVADETSLVKLVSELKEKEKQLSTQLQQAQQSSVNDPILLGEQYLKNNGADPATIEAYRFAVSGTILSKNVNGEYIVSDEEVLINAWRNESNGRLTDDQLKNKISTLDEADIIIQAEQKRKSIAQDANNEVKAIITEAQKANESVAKQANTNHEALQKWSNALNGYKTAVKTAGNVVGGITVNGMDAVRKRAIEDLDSGRLFTDMFQTDGILDPAKLDVALMLFYPKVPVAARQAYLDNHASKNASKQIAAAKVEAIKKELSATTQSVDTQNNRQKADYLTPEQTKSISSSGVITLDKNITFQ